MSKILRLHVILAVSCLLAFFIHHVVSESMTLQQSKQQQPQFQQHSPQQPQSRRRTIVGGENALPNRYPSMVFLADREDRLQCGGTLISPSFVLTSAHCEVSLVIDAVFNRYNSSSKDPTTPTPTDVGGIMDTVHSNDTTTLDNTTAINERRINVRQEIKHPQYSKATLQYDIMLLLLEEPIYDVPFMRLDDGTILNTIEKKTIQQQEQQQQSDDNDTSLTTTTEWSTVSRMDSNPEDTGNNETGSSNVTSSSSSSSFSSSPSYSLNAEQLMALGWGHSQTGAPTDVLQQVALGLVPNAWCEQATENFSSYMGRIFADMMCTFASERDTCYGDSGGPIFVKGERHEDDVQVGIVSWYVGI